uniref:Uncharacterized protein n=1 Tax=Sphaerodactylus townsendi TaxID=933632 RepID=A0ACB8F935_9SAUR
MARLFSGEWLAGSSRGAVGGPADHCNPAPLRQRDSSHEERQIRSSSRMGSPEAPEQSSRSSSEFSVQEQEGWEARSHGSDTSAPHSVRGRTKFSPRQLQELEKSFQGQQYLGASEKRRLSKVLKLSPLQSYEKN